MKERKTFWDKNAGRYDRFMQKDRAAYEEVAVKNRYLMPIASTTISATNGKIHNSYGYAD